MNFDIRTLLTIAGAIILGSVAHIAKMIMDKSDLMITLTIILSSLAISCFAGLLFGLLTSVYTDEVTWIIIASSLGAFMGDKGIERVWEKVLDLISKK